VTISAQQKSFLAEILEDRPIPEVTLIYFRERFRDKLHSAILEAFLIRAQEKDLKQQDLAARIHRTKAQISRWFNAPSNLTLDSISDLMVGLAMDFDAFPFTPIEETVALAERAEEITNQGEASIHDTDNFKAAIKNLLFWLEQLRPSGEKLSDWLSRESAGGSESALPAPAIGAESKASEKIQGPPRGSRKILPFPDLSQRGSEEPQIEIPKSGVGG